MCEKHPCRHQGQRRRGEGAVGIGAEVPLQPLERIMVNQIASLQPIEDPTL